MDARNSDDARSLVTTRLFDAPRELVFEAWTHPVHIRHWWGPIGFTTTTHSFDFRPGGVWRLVMHGPDGRDYHNRITFDEIVAPERIAFHHSEGDDEVERVHHRTLVTFEDVGGKTKLTMRLIFSSATEKERVAREYGAAEGLVQTVGRLFDYIASWEGNGGLEKKVHLTRLIKAPRALVFEAFTDPRHLANWWGPSGFTNPICEFDARPGGAIRIHMKGPGEIEHPMTGTVHEVLPPERIVFTAVARDSRGNALLESHTTVTLREEGDATRITIEARAKGLAPIARTMLAGMDLGWMQSLDRLAALTERGVKT